MNLFSKITLPQTLFLIKLCCRYSENSWLSLLGYYDVCFSLHVNLRFCFPDVNECSINKGGRSDDCTDLVIGFKCTCPLGYELAKDNKSCIDIDECKILGICTQSCVNYKDSYACECDKGYSLNPINKKICRAEGIFGF